MMSARVRSPRRFDPRALPVAAKIALGLVLVLAASGFVLDRLVQQVVRDAQTETVMQDLQMLSRGQANRVVDELGQEIVALNQLGSDPGIRESLFAALERNRDAAAVSLMQFATDPILQETLAQFRRTNVEFDSVVLLDTWGHILAMDPVPPGLEERPPEVFDWFTAAYDGQQGYLFVSGPRGDQLTGVSGVHIAVPIRAPNVIGVLYGIWDMSTVADITSMGANREGLVIEPDGSVLLSQTRPRGSTIAADLVGQLRQAPEGAFLYTTREGQEWLYGYTTFSSLDLATRELANLRWVVVTRVPLDIAQAGAAQLISRLRVAIAVSTAAVTMLIALLALILLRPLRRLTDAAARIRSGDLDTPIPALPADEIGQLGNTLREMVEQLLKRLRQLSAAVQVSRATVTTLDINQLLSDVARAVTEQFGHPAVSIYLAEPSLRQARLQASAATDSAVRPAAGQRITIDQTSGVGRAILFNEPQTDRSGTRPELALPLWVGDRPLGAMQVMGPEGFTFQPEDINILTLITDQLGAAIENARLFEESASNLAEIEALNRRLTRQAWEDHLAAGGALRHTLDPERQWPQALETVRAHDEVRAGVFENADGRLVLAAPLVLRGESIGTLAVTRPAGQRWSRTEIALVEAIAARLVMIADTIRLVEETSQRAAREQQVNEVSATLLQRAASVDSVLQQALSELSSALGSDHISLRIGQPPGEEGRHVEGSENGGSAQREG
jgi:GAF domain-containing protein